PAEAKASRGPARYGASVRGRWKWHSWALAKPCAASCPGSSSRSSPSLLGFSVSTPDGAEPGATKRPMVRNSDQVWTALVGSRGMASPVSGVRRRRRASDHHGAPGLSAHEQAERMTLRITHHVERLVRIVRAVHEHPGAELLGAPALDLELLGIGHAEVHV